MRGCHCGTSCCRGYRAWYCTPSAPLDPLNSCVGPSRAAKLRLRLHQPCCDDSGYTAMCHTVHRQHEKHHSLAQAYTNIASLKIVCNTESEEGRTPKTPAPLLVRQAAATCQQGALAAHTLKYPQIRLTWGMHALQTTASEQTSWCWPLCCVPEPIKYPDDHVACCLITSPLALRGRRAACKGLCRRSSRTAFAPYAQRTCASASTHVHCISCHTLLQYLQIQTG